MRCLKYIPHAFLWYVIRISDKWLDLIAGGPGKDWWPCQRCWNDCIWEKSGRKNGTIRIENALEEFCCEVLGWGPAITRRKVRLKLCGVLILKMRSMTVCLSGSTVI